MIGSIYDSDITTKCFALMQKTFSSKELEQFKAFGEELEGIIKSYDPNNEKNKEIFMQAQSLSTFIMSYAHETATFLGGEKYRRILLQKIDPITFLTEHTPARIAYNMSEECGKKGLAEIKFLTDTLNTIKDMY